MSRNAEASGDYIIKLAEAQAVLAQVPGATLAQDSAGRLTDIAVDHSEFAHLGDEQIAAVVAVMRAHGLTATVSSIHVNGWFGTHTKWTAAQWMLQRLFGRELLELVLPLPVLDPARDHRDRRAVADGELEVITPADEAQRGCQLSVRFCKQLSMRAVRQGHELKKAPWKIRHIGGQTTIHTPGVSAAIATGQQVIAHDLEELLAWQA